MIDLSKTYRTRDGREARVFMTDAGGHTPVCGAIRNPDGVWVTTHWFPDGRWLRDSEHHVDLIEVKPRIKREAWVNVYPDDLYLHRTHVSAANTHLSGTKPIARVKITIDCEEGEGL